jgi:hypothetical protein
MAATPLERSAAVRYGKSVPYTICEAAAAKMVQ